MKEPHEVSLAELAQEKRANTPLGALTLSDIVKTIFFIAIGFVLTPASAELRWLPPAGLEARPRSKTGPVTNRARIMK